MPISSELFSALEKGGGLAVEKTPPADKPAPQGGGSTFDRLLRQESGGRQTDKNGNVITSSKGAIGIAQVMPATGPEAAKLAGVEWDPVRFKSDAEYNKALGRAYFDKQLSVFGDERLALAAYNAGPGAVRLAIARSAKNGGDPLEYLPLETQKYVPAILGADAGAKPKGPKWADDKAIVRDDGRPGAIAKSDAVRAGPTAGDMAKAFGASALSGVGDMGQGLIGEPLAWLANKAAGTEEFEGQNLLAGVAESIRDDMTEGGKIARQDVPSGDVFQPETWKLPETTGGMLMIGADGLGSLVPSILPFVGQAGKAANLAKAAQAAKVAGDFEKASQLAIQAERASRVAKGAGAVGGFAMTGGAAAGEVRQNIERELQGKSHEELIQAVPLYREAFEKTGDARMARQAVANGAAQYATLFAGAMGAVGGGINAKLLEDVIVKRGLSAALGKMSGNAAVRAGVGAGASAVGEGLQEVSEKMGQNAGENVGMGRPIADNVTRDSFGDFIGGAMIGGPMGGVGGGASLQVKQPVQPVIKQNSPLSNMASVGQAAQANAAAQSNLAIQQQALAEQEAGLDPSQAIADPTAAAQDAVRRRIMAEQQKAAPQQDYSAAEDAENEIGQATGFEQQDQILEFNRLLAEEQASLAEQRGDIAEAQQIRAAEAANREAIRASRARNRVGKPSGSFGQMNEFADLLSEEQADIESQRAEVAAKQDQQRQTEALRAQSELESTDARVSAQMAREAEARRRDILGSVIEQGISGVNPVADVAGRFSAELMRQGYRDTAPTDAETQSILRAVDVANAREDGPLPSLPNEGDFYAPPKAQRTAPPKAESKPKQQPNRRLTPKEIREYVAAGAILNGDTLTLPDGTVLKLKGPQIAAAREAMRKVAPAQVETAPDQANETEVSPQDSAPQQVESPAAVSASPAETYDVSTRTDDQLRYLANNGKPGWKEAAQAEMARREGAKPEIRSDLDAAAHEAATSPLNDTPQPTDGQKSAGNYKVGRVRVQGMDISIENPKGSVRSGTSPDGRKWESTLHAHYGYFTGTKAADGDHLDVYLTDGAEDAPMVWVIDQKNADGTFDEHKTLLGPRTEEEAKAAYLANYEPGWDGIGAISSMPIEAFKAWAFDGKKKRKPLVYVEPEAPAAEASDTATAQPDPREAYANQKAEAYIAQRGGNAPPKAVEAVRIGARKEFDKAEATHKDPGEPAEAATPAVVAKSIQKSARNTEFNPAEAKKWLIGEIDKAVANVPAENAELAAELAREKVKTFDMQAAERRYGKGSKAASSARDSFNALRDSNVAKIVKQIGFVTFDVPGDGKFKVLNTVDGLNAFRSKVEKSSGFKAPANKPPVMERETDTGSYTPRDALADGEFLNAYELARLQGKPLRFSVGSGRPNAYTDASDVKGLIPGFKTFVGRKADSSKMPWAVIEESTGLAIGDGGTSKAAAIAAANAKMKGHEQAIADKLKRGGISDAKLQDQLEADWIKWAEEREGRKLEDAEEVAPAADPNPEPTPLDFTPKQYHEARMKWVAQEYGLSDAEVRQDYDTPAARDADNQAWVDAVRQAFKDGTELTRATLDKLEELRPGALLSNLHDYPEARIPAGYQLPSARKAENEASAAKRESKKQIAASFAEGRAKREELTPSDLTNIFAGLSSRGLAKTRAQKAAQAHPRAEQIAYVQDNFLDILTELEDSGIVKINCD